MQQRKHEWRKNEKEIYLPKTEPMLVDVPLYKYLSIKGAGNPNSKAFSEVIVALYSVSYAIKMNLKKIKIQPKGYTDYIVYPLEGIWDIADKAKENFNGVINKDDLVFDLMIRQPDFVEHSYFEEMLELTKKKRPQALLDRLQFKSIRDNRCIQMMHIGPFENEPESFKRMETYAVGKGLKRKSKLHREIYLSDFRKVSEEKLKTILRFEVLPSLKIMGDKNLPS